MEILECGETAETGGDPGCHWHLSFAADNVEWTYSDVVELGDWSCTGDEVTVSVGDAGTASVYTGSWSDKAALFTFEGVDYSPILTMTLD